MEASANCCGIFNETHLRRWVPWLSGWHAAQPLAATGQLTMMQEVEPMLGPACVQELCERHTAQTPAPTDAGLLAEMEPYWAWATACRLLLAPPGLRLDPQGLVQHTEPSFGHADDTQRHQMLAQAAGNAAFFRRRFANWLAENALAYPCLPPTKCPPAQRFADLPSSSVAD